MKWFSTLRSRTAALTGVVSLIAVLIAGIVALPLIRDAAESQAQVALAHQADLAQNVAIRPNDFDTDSDHMNMGGPGMAEHSFAGVVGYLRAQGIVVQAVIPGQSEPAELTRTQIANISSGQPVSGRTCTIGSCVFIEARPVGTGTGIVLTQPLSVASSVMNTAIARIFLALIVGLVIAVIIGLVVAGRIAKPLANAADAAHRLAGGERDVRLTPEGPEEISEIAIALNVLAAELTHSEERQREFLLSISHELRTPLTAIRGYSDAMTDGVIEPHEIAEVGAIMSAESIRLDRLVSDLLELARFGAVDFKIDASDVDLVDVLKSAGDVWQDRCAREGVVFTVESPQHPVVVNTDVGRVRQIIDNLAENALRVTPTGAPIVFSLTENAVLEIRDGGPGLSPEDIDVAFEPGELYDRYKGVRKVGTGFGLALVGRLATRLGATATAGTAPEGGARFTIDFSARQTA